MKTSDLSDMTEKDSSSSNPSNNKNTSKDIPECLNFLFNGVDSVSQGLLSKNNLASHFLEKCEGKRPWYKIVLREEGKWFSKYPWVTPPLIILILTLIIVIPSIIVKIFYLGVDLGNLVFADIITVLTFVIVGCFMLFSMRLIESSAVTLMCIDHYKHFTYQGGETHFLNYIKEVQSTLYDESYYSKSCIFSILSALLILVSIHVIGGFIPEIGFNNTFFQYVGENFSHNDSVNEQGFLITVPSLLTRLLFEFGWSIAVVCMIGLAFYVIRLFYHIGNIEKYNPDVNLFHPDRSAGFHSVSRLLFLVEALGVIFIILIQILLFFLFNSGYYDLSSIALLPIKGTWSIIAISALFALVPIAIAIFVFVYPHKGIKRLIAHHKKEKLLKYAVLIHDYEKKLQNKLKSDVDIQFLMAASIQIQGMREGPFNLETFVTSIIVAIPSFCIPIITFLYP